jgi:toxin-antitoxin system PIN domain toxin
VFVVDTNVLVAAANQDDRAHRVCRELVERWRRQSGAWYTTWSVIYEFARVVTHPRVLARPWSFEAALRFADSLLTSPALGVLVETPRHQEVAAELAREVKDLAGNLVHDAHIAVLMREHGIRRIYTRDTDFFRFPFLEPVDPLRPQGPPGTAEPAARYRRSKRARGGAAASSTHDRPK